MGRRLVRRTRRLVVRPFTKSDYSAWKATHLGLSPARNRWDRGPSKESELTKTQFSKMLRALNRQMKRDVFYDLGVFDRDGALVGTVAVMEVARGISHTAYLGYRLYNPYWGKGYAAEAVRACLDIAFRDLKLHRMEAGIEPQNARSIRLAKSLGMRREGVKKRMLFLRKRWVDLVQYTLTTEDLGVRFDERVFKNWRPRV